MSIKIISNSISISISISIDISIDISISISIDISISISISISITCRSIERKKLKSLPIIHRSRCIIMRIALELESLRTEVRALFFLLEL